MNAMNGFMPMLHGMNIPAPPVPPVFQMPFLPAPGEPARGWSEIGNKAGKQREAFQSGMNSFRGQMHSMHQSSREASRKQWNILFSQYMEMQKSFAASLPDEVPSIPGVPVCFPSAISPRAFLEKMNDFREMTNANAMNQADAFFDFIMPEPAQTPETASDKGEHAETASETKNEAISEKKAEVKSGKKAGVKSENQAESESEKKGDARSVKQTGAKSEKKTEAKSKKTAGAKSEKQAGAVKHTSAAKESGREDEGYPADKNKDRNEGSYIMDSSFSDMNRLLNRSRTLAEQSEKETQS